LDNKIGQF